MIEFDSKYIRLGLRGGCMKRNTATALAVVVLGWFYFNHMQDPVARYTAYPFDYRDVVVSAAEKKKRCHHHWWLVLF